MKKDLISKGKQIFCWKLQIPGMHRLRKECALILNTSKTYGQMVKKFPFMQLLYNGLLIQEYDVQHEF